jgi:ATP adenylyltransferase/5',5'''-P-1,P-4-tetraphosphate phosphorylase II
LNDIHQDQTSGLTPDTISELSFDIYESLAGLVFFGVPHLGSRVGQEKRVKVLQFITSPLVSKPDRVVSALEFDSNEVKDLCSQFEKTTIFTRPTIRIWTYYETKTTAKFSDVVGKYTFQKWMSDAKCS